MRRSLPALLLAAATLWACPSFAQTPQCGPVADVLAGFKTQFGEDIVMVGASGEGRTFLVIANQSTGTWTVFTTQGDIACARASGTDFTIKQAPPPGDPT